MLMIFAFVYIGLIESYEKKMKKRNLIKIKINKFVNNIGKKLFYRDNKWKQDFHYRVHYNILNITLFFVILFLDAFFLNIFFIF